MRSYVLDTSVAAAWYLPEEFSPAARKWQQDMVEERIALIAPSLHLQEFANVLRTYVVRGELAEDLAKDIFGLHLDAPLKVVEPSSSTILDIALQYEATAYDAVYISLSLEHNIPLLTAERTTTPWVVKLGAMVESVWT